MKKALSIAKEISREYSQHVDNKRYKKIVCQSVDQKEKEKFLAKCSMGEISVTASNPQAAAYAISQLRMGVLSGHLSDYLADQKPLYPLRPLWISCNSQVAITDKVGVSLPSFFLEKNRKVFEFFCRRLLELGFNAVILGSDEFAFCEKSPVVFKELPLLYEMLSDYGIRLLLKPTLYYRSDEELHFVPNSPTFQEKIRGALADLCGTIPSLDYLLWESCYHHPDFQRHPVGRELTKLEKSACEVRLLEEALGNASRLIYYLPCTDVDCAEGQSDWIPDLLNAMKVGTVFAFSTVAGNPKDDHLPPHPFWEKLRSEMKVASTPLLPILNSGAVSQGEGLWPGLTYDSVDEAHVRCLKGQFLGVANLAGHMPREGSLADCNLWVAGQRLWRSISSRLLAESWFEARRPDLDFNKHQEIFYSARQITKGLSFLRSMKDEKNREKLTTEECRLFADSLLAQIKYLEALAHKKEGAVPSGRTVLSSYIQFFANDARRIIAHSLQLCSISMNQPVESEGRRDGIWTEVQGGDGGRTVSQIILLKEARMGEPGSPLHRLMWESRIDVD